MIAESIIQSVDVGVDPRTAFDLYTGEINRWYRSSPHSWNDPEQAIGTRFEPGLGGRWIEIWDDETGEGYEIGRIVAWEPGSRLAFTYHTVNMPSSPLTEVELRFTPAGDGTRVTLEHRGWELLPPGPATGRWERTREGWATLLGWFRDYVVARMAREPVRPAGAAAAPRAKPAAPPLVRTVEVATDPARAFSLFTGSIDAWFPRSPHSWNNPARAVAMKIEAKAGGRWLEVWDAATGEGYEIGRLSVCEPGAKLVTSFRNIALPAEPPTELEIRFDATAKGTRVTLEHRGLDLLPPELAARWRYRAWIAFISAYGGFVAGTQSGNARL